MGHRDNNLDVLRLAASLAVVVGHAWPLTGAESAPRLAGILLSHLAVFVFFSISGYLVATSWKFSPHARTFLARRAARIFPALIVVVIVTVLALGPAVTRLPVSEYFGSSVTWRYLSGLVLAPTYSLPGVFPDNPTTAVNGSLWTLGPEFLCYMVVLVVGLGVLGVKNARPNLVTPIAFGGMACLLAVIGVFGADKALRDSCTAMAFFAVGAVLAYLPRLHLPVWTLGLIVAAWAVAGAGSREIGVALGWVVVPVVALSLGLRSTRGVRRAGRFGDFSYGLYLWAFPVQQIVVFLFPALPLWLGLVLVIVVTGMLAVASWHLVEKRALRWAKTYSESESRRTFLLNSRNPHEMVSDIPSEGEPK